jgi:hypothetical protein
MEARPVDLSSLMHVCGFGRKLRILYHYRSRNDVGGLLDDTSCLGRSGSNDANASITPYIRQAFRQGWRKKSRR